jgi:hypothetical protein
MAGMDWFRWHHGSVTDPKFRLIARKSGCSVAEVIGFWATLLESASMNEIRGRTGSLDFESLDCSLGLQDGKSQELHSLMIDRGLIDDDSQSIHSWSKRQPLREREDDKSTERVKAFREKKRNETPCNANETPCNANETPCNAEKRLEEIREDKNTNTPPTPADKSADVVPPGFAAFWATWPSNDRKQAKGKCLSAWKKAHAERDAALVLSHVEHLASSQAWTKENGQFVPAPLSYLNKRAWEGFSDVSEATPAVNPAFAGGF